MKITVLSLFPDILRGFFESSIMAKAIARGLMSYELIDIRDYATDKHHKADDEVFGGGAGMLMLPAPLSRALEAAGSPKKRTIYMTPSGRLLNQAYARELSGEEELVIVCGRYEGIDQRVIDTFVSDEISIGDYVLSSGEVAALVLVDTLYRLVPGVISGESLHEESFGSGRGPDPGTEPSGEGAAGLVLLEYPQYTRPAEYGSMRVPEVLTSGHHAKIERWRLRASLAKTLAYRPELLAAPGLPTEVRKLLHELAAEGRNHEPYTEDPGTAD